MEVKTKITPIAYSVHRSDQNPIFGTGSTHVRLQDDGAGGYVELEQFDDDIKPGLIKFDFAELTHILKAVEMLKEASCNE